MTTSSRSFLRSQDGAFYCGKEQPETTFGIHLTTLHLLLSPNADLMSFHRLQQTLCEAVGTSEGKWLRLSHKNKKNKGHDAVAAIDFFKATACPTEPQKLGEPTTSPMWHDAVALYIESLSPQDQEAILSTKTGSSLTTQSLEQIYKPLLETHRQGTVMKILLKLGSSLQHVRSFATVVDIAIQSHPNVACLIWGGIRLLLEISCRTIELSMAVSSMFERLSNYLPIFETWARLFPQANYTEISACLTQTYFEYISIIVDMIKFARRSGIGTLIRTAFSSSFQRHIKNSEARIQDITGRLALQVQSAGIRSSMKRDQEIKKLLYHRLNHVDTFPPLLLPIRFLQGMPRSDRFYERAYFTDQISSLLLDDRGPTKSVVLYGFLGCGKSAIAAEYVVRSLDMYDAVFYFSVEDNIKLERQYTRIARHLGFVGKTEDVSSMRAHVMNWLLSTDLKWLILFDGVPNGDTLKAHLPTVTKGAVLTTSRDPLVFDGCLASRKIHVPAFSMREGAAFLLSFLERPSSTATEDLAAADLISESFSGWPAGLRTAAAFIRQKRLTPARFVKLQINRQEKSQRTCFLAGWSPVVSLLDFALRDIPDDARQLLDCLSFLVPHEVPVEFLDSTTFQFLDAREWLSSRSLVVYDEAGDLVSMDHCLQSVWFEKLMVAPNRYNAALEKVVDSLTKVIPNLNFVRPRNPDAWEVQETYVTYVSLLARSSHKDLGSKIACGLLNLVVRVIHYFFEVGNYQLGFDHVKMARLIEQRHGVIDPEVLSLLAYVHGRLATETCQASLSVDLFDRALNLSAHVAKGADRESLENDEIYVARLYSCLGNALTTVNRFDEAQKSHESALDIALKVEESPSSRLGMLYANLGSCLLWKGEYDVAEQLLRKALLQHDRGLECILYALGNVFLRQGQPFKALELHREVLQSLTKTMGKNHHTVADSCHKIGSIYALDGFERRDLNQAEAFLRKALEIYKFTQKDGRDFMRHFIARTEWKLSKVLQALKGFSDDEAKLIEDRSHTYIQETAKCPVDASNGNDQIERAFDDLLFFWSR